MNIRRAGGKIMSHTDSFAEEEAHLKKGSFGMTPLMNDTKWNEIRLAMYQYPKRIVWRTKSLTSGYICQWDGEWYYHFSEGGYDWVEWLEIRLDDDDIKSYVISKLKEIHVPGEIDGNVVRVYGHKDGFVDYI